MIHASIKSLLASGSEIQSFTVYVYTLEERARNRPFLTVCVLLVWCVTPLVSALVARLVCDSFGVRLFSCVVALVCDSFGVRLFMCGCFGV